MGVRLRWIGTEQLTWGDLRVIISQAPRDSAINRAMNPDAASWSTEAQLLHSIEHSQRVSLWAKGEKPRRADYPKPIPAPWVEDEKEIQTFGSDPVPLSELDSFLGWT